LSGAEASRAARAGRGILSYFTRHRTAANLLFVLLIVSGLWAFPQMRAQFFPDVISDDVDVSVAWDGAGAEDVDAAIVQLLEPALLAVEGVSATSSRSSEGRASIEVTFEPGWDMARAQEDVERAVGGVGNLPASAEAPEVRRSAWRDRVTDVVITGPVSPEQLGRFADEFTARLFVAGVTRVTLQGVAAPATVIEVPTLALVEHGLELSEIAAIVGAASQPDPAGEIAAAGRVRTGAARTSAEALAGLVIGTGPDGAALTLGEVAEIRTEGVDRLRAYFVGENPAVSLRVDRSEEGDAIGIQRAVEEAAAELAATLPEGVTIELIRTRAEAISGRLDILLDNGLMGLGLVVLLLFLFLNARTALWVAAGIPAAMLAAIAVMYLAGLTLNMMSLFALIITLGIVVDDAIVVGEHADSRARRLGEAPHVAAETAARRMFLPVLAATLTTVIAFFGLVSIGGVFGTLIADIPFTVIAVLLASLVECFLVLPNHMAHAIAATAKERWYDWPSRQVNRGFRHVRERAFRPLMGLVVRARYVVLAGAVALLASQAAQVISGEVQWRFFNAPEQGSVTGNFAMAPGATREDTLEMMRAMQRAVAEVGAAYEAEHGRNPVTYVIAEIGGNAGRGLAGASTKEPDQLGAISIELIDADERPYSSFAFVADLQEAVVQHPLAETVSFRGWRSGPGGDSLSVELFGASAPVLKEAAEALKAELPQYPEVSALQDSLAYDKEELQLALTPRGEALGFRIDALGRILRDRLNGIEAATYPDGPRSATIRVELPPGELTADFLDRTLLAAPSGSWVPLADIVTVERSAGFSTVRRENGVRLISVTGDLSEDDPARAAEITAALTGDILPRIEERFGVSSATAGLAEQEREFLSDARTGLILCLLGIYLVLTWIFSSWTRPLVVMAVIPFGLVGAIWGHAAWGVPLSMFSVVGLLGMTGIIINDSIVLVTTIDEEAERRGLLQAIVEGASDRLRPVLLTTATTVLGLTPLLYEGSSQAEFLKPTVITLVYGLGFGMLLVLLLVPALMAIGADFGARARSARRAVSAPRRAGALGLAAAGLSAGLFAVIVGPALVTGAPLPALGPLLPAALPGVAGALALYLGVLAAALALIWLGAGLRRGARRDGAPAS
jgi:multidrug efflux pump subunit AcrB